MRLTVTSKAIVVVDACPTTPKAIVVVADGYVALRSIEKPQVTSHNNLFTYLQIVYNYEATGLFIINVRKALTATPKAIVVRWHIPAKCT
jgi:hypothetical protein